MKKSILALILSVSVILCSGCSKTEENSELDELISGLPTMYLDGGSNDPEDSKPAYKSITGTITAVSKKNITVKTDDKEYKIATDKNPQIFGGSVEKGLTVTVTFETDQDEEKTITPVTITILDGNPDTTVSEKETAPVSETSETAAEETSESSTLEISETESEATPEASEAETEAITETAEETSEVSSDTSEAQTQA